MVTKKKRSLYCANLKKIILYISALLTLCFMVMCLISAWFSMVQLKTSLSTYVNQFKAVKVSEYQAPALVFLANGAYTYECIHSEFRFDPKAQDSDFPDLDPEDKRGRVQPSCKEQSMPFTLTLADLTNTSNTKSFLEQMPDWLQKNLITTMDHAATCADADSDRRRRAAPAEKYSARHRPSPNVAHAERVARDAVDDLDRCDGQCEVIWNCADNPESCAGHHILTTCFNRHNQFHDQASCRDVHECLAGETEMTSCEDVMRCLDPEEHFEPECDYVVECLDLASKETDVCRDVFQCIEDQVQPKCELYVTPDPALEAMTEEEVNQACGAVDSILDQPELLTQNNAPLTLIIMKGPQEYKNRDFVFTSLRLSEGEKGVWVGLHPSFEEMEKRFNESITSSSNSSVLEGKLNLLLSLIEELRWGFKAREFRSFNFMTQSVTKLEGAVQEVSIRLELTMTRINTSETDALDYKPVEVVFQWKDGYIIEGNKFIGVSAFDAFAILAGVLLMLERAWLTWGRLIKKLVEANGRSAMEKYEVGSPEWLALKSIVDSGQNLVTAILALKKLNVTSKKLERQAIKKKREQQRAKEREEARMKKIKKKLALKFGAIDDEVMDWDEKRRVEWEIYKNLIREESKKMSEAEKKIVEMEEERMKRLTVEENEDRSASKNSKKHRKYRNKYARTAGSGSRSSTHLSDSSFSLGSDEDISEGGGTNRDWSQAQVKPRGQIQQELQEKRSRKINAMFQLPEAKDDALHSSLSGDITKSNPWANKVRAGAK